MVQSLGTIKFRVSGLGFTGKCLGLGFLRFTEGFSGPYEGFYNGALEKLTSSCSKVQPHKAALYRLLRV